MVSIHLLSKDSNSLLGRPQVAYSLIAFCQLRKMGFLFQARKNFSCQSIYPHVPQIKPFVEYCSYLWGEANPTTLNLLHYIQRRVFQLINNPLLGAKIGQVTLGTCVYTTDVSIVRLDEQCLISSEEIQFNC